MESGIGSAVARGDLVFDVTDAAYGAKGDGQRVRGVTAATGSPIVTFTAGSFTSADVGKVCVVYTDTAAGTITTIASVQSMTQVTMASNASIGVTGTTGYFLYGSDDSAAFTAAFAAASAQTTVDTTVGPNQPQGFGQPVVLAPQNAPQSTYLLANPITVPSSVTLDCAGMLVNLIASRTNPAVVFNPYSSGKRFSLEAMFGAGIQLGSGAGNQADIHLGDVTLWHVGKATGTIAVNALGYGFLIDLIWCKGGDTGIVHNAGSDWFCNRAFLIGCHTAISMSQSNQVRYNGIVLDSCGEVGGGYSGIVLDNACSDITFAAQAFCVTGLTRSLDNVVLIGNGSTNKNVVLRMQVLAQKTGGNGINFAQAQDVECDLLASNTASNSSGGNNLTTAVVFGTVAGSFRCDAELNGTVTPYSGSPAGLYRYTRGGVEYVVQGGGSPTVAVSSAVVGTGGSVGATVPAGNDQRGKVSVVSGSTGPFAAGANLVTVTFLSNNGYVAAPVPLITPTNVAAAGIGLYISSVTTTAFVVGCTGTPAANTTYTFNYGLEA